jgi:hypothetical protein
MDYQQWNRAIAEYFIAGFPAGTHIYLSVDEDALEDIGLRSGGALRQGPSWTVDFLQAVRGTCVHGRMVSQMPLYGANDDGLPHCAFIGAMVLAASHMAEEESAKTVTRTQLFTRLREVLGLSTEDGGRPPGLDDPGCEEPHWLFWNRWLLLRGFLPTADRGSGGTKYIHYPLSPVLLREGDKARLEEILREEVRANRLPRFCGGNTMGCGSPQAFSYAPLGRLSDEEDERRFDAAASAC